MKKLFIGLILIFLINSATAQWNFSCGTGGQPTKVQAGVLIDWSLRSFPPTGFTGMGIHAGVWADHIGVFAGFVEYKLKGSPADRVGAITIATRYNFMKDDRLATSAFFAAGTQNYQDYGLRVGYDVWNNGVSVGAMASRTMHYGLCVMMTIKNKND